MVNILMDFQYYNYNFKLVRTLIFEMHEDYYYIESDYETLSKVVIDYKSISIDNSKIQSKFKKTVDEDYMKYNRIPFDRKTLNKLIENIGVFSTATKVVSGKLDFTEIINLLKIKELDSKIKSIIY